MDIGKINEPVDLAPGEWIDDIPEMEGVAFRVRSTNYKPFRVATAGLARRAGKKLNTDAGLHEFNIATGKPLADHILLDWRGVTSGSDEMPFSTEQALAILTADDPRGIGSAFRRGVEWAGDQVAERLNATAQDAAGNS
jgi:hypothetical protein